ncbi:ketoacyl-ACP synthase III [Asticcacaulis sp. W401b]|uniref:ketoacyl-ACP synthase III n=1 Tax=Asticcacaulis sp. W401b TaxID=3388666 RepID=UPI00397049AD
MAAFATTGPVLRGIVTALPESVSENRDLGAQFGDEAITKIIAATGIERRPVSEAHTVSQLGEVAARRLLDGLGWAADSVGLMIVVTQTPDYPLPSTACVLQNRLGVGPGALCLDIALGCSGYVYGLSVVSSLMQSAGIARALLVAGDMTTRMIDEDNRALKPLFGDAVSVTALEGAEAQIAFDLGSDGSGAPYLISRTGGLVESGPPRLFMDGTQVMAFSLKQVAPSIARALDAAGETIEAMEHVVLHQANALMLKTLGHKIKARDDQMVYAVRDYGNTSSASIPLALCDRFLTGQKRLSNATPLRLLLCGFGVGWSWSSAVWTTPAPDLIDIVRVR